MLVYLSWYQPRPSRPQDRAAAGRTVIDSIDPERADIVQYYLDQEVIAKYSISAAEDGSKWLITPHLLMRVHRHFKYTEFKGLESWKYAVVRRRKSPHKCLRLRATLEV